MWVLINESDEESTYALHPGKVLLVGRMQSDIKVPLDTSISRKHAKIFIEDDEPDLFDVGEAPQRPKVTIQDLGSTFGTYVGDDAVASSASCSQDDRITSQVVLTDGIRIRFGLHSTIFRLSWRHYACTSSSLTDKSSLKSALDSVGGELVRDWRDDVTHVVMNEIILTIKVVNALAKCIPIVTPSFFADLKDCARSQQPLPVASNYLPRLREHLINASEVSCAVDERRRTLLQNFTIVFRDAEQMRKFETAIRYCGGMCLAYDGSGAEVAVSDVRHDGYVVISPPKSESARNPKFSSLANALIRRGMTLIPEQNIGTAILKVCTDVDLNPRRADLIWPAAAATAMPSQLLESHCLLASETLLPSPAPTPSPAPSARHIPETASPPSQKAQKAAERQLAEETADTMVFQVKKEEDGVEDAADVTPRASRKRAAPSSSTGGAAAKRAQKQLPISQYLVPESSQGSQPKRQTRATAKRPLSPPKEPSVSSTPAASTVSLARDDIPKKRTKAGTPTKETVHQEEGLDNPPVIDLEAEDCRPAITKQINTSGFVTKAAFKKLDNSACDIPLEELTRSYCEMALKPLVIARGTPRGAPQQPNPEVNFKRFKKQVVASRSQDTVRLTTTRLSVVPAEASGRPASSTSLVNWMSGASKSRVNASKATINFSDDDEDLAEDDIVSTRANKDEDDDDMWNFEKS